MRYMDDEESLMSTEDVGVVEEQDENGLYEHHRITVDKGQAMLRLDKYLQLRLEGISRNKKGGLYCGE